MKRFAILAAFALSGCASQIMESFVGKDVTEAYVAHGTPTAIFDMPDGRRAFQWMKRTDILMPSTTSYTGTAYGNMVTGTATTYGGGVSSQECVYTAYGKKNSKGSYTITSFEKPSIWCE